MQLTQFYSALLSVIFNHYQQQLKRRTKPLVGSSVRTPISLLAASSWPEIATQLDTWIQESVDETEPYLPYLRYCVYVAEQLKPYVDDPVALVDVEKQRALQKQLIDFIALTTTLINISQDARRDFVFLNKRDQTQGFVDKKTKKLTVLGTIVEAQLTKPFSLTEQLDFVTFSKDLIEKHITLSVLKKNKELILNLEAANQEIARLQQALLAAAAKNSILSSRFTEVQEKLTGETVAYNPNFNGSFWTQSSDVTSAPRVNTIPKRRDSLLRFPFLDKTLTENLAQPMDPSTGPNAPS